MAVLNLISKNGNLCESSDLESLHSNRAFMLGDGFFESIRVVNGQIKSWNAHYARIQACCRAMHMDIPSVFSLPLMRGGLEKLLAANQIDEGGRIRLTVFREGAGTYRPVDNRMGFIAEAHSLDHNGFIVQDQGLSIDVFKDMQKMPGKLSPFKVLGNHIYVQASIWAVGQSLNDALIINYRNRIIEATSSNIFMVKNGEVHTPAVSEGCVGGVMRMSVINAAIASDIPIFESEIDENDLLTADEIFLTNAIRISWIASFRGKRYYHKVSDRLIARVNEMEAVIS